MKEIDVDFIVQKRNDAAGVTIYGTLIGTLAEQVLHTDTRSC